MLRLVGPFLFVGIFAFFVSVGCQKLQEEGQEAPPVSEQKPKNHETAKTVVAIPPAADTTASLQRQAADVESRLESLLALIEEKENSLLSREQNLLAREESLLVKSANLSEREQRLVRLQIVSWVVFGVGVVGIILGFVISGRSRRKETGKAKAEQTAKGAQEAQKAYAAKMEAQLKEWQTKIKSLTAKTDKAKADAKKEYQKILDELNEKTTAAQKKMQDLKSASTESWESLKDGLEDAWKDLKKAVDNAVAKIK